MPDDHSPARTTIVITGAAGKVGSLIRPILRDRGHRLRLLDVTEIDDVAAGETFHPGSVTDAALLEEVFTGADLVVHLGGLSKETDWASVLATNIDGGHTVLESAHRVGVHRLLLASSLHAVGYLPLGEAGADLPYPRPDTYYGVSKVAVEALGSLYADRYPMMIISARLGTVHPVVDSARLLRTWLSPADLVRLVEVALRRDEPGHHVVWAVSANTRGVVSLAAGRAIGYEPRDDAEHALRTDPELEERNPYVGTHLAGRVIEPGHPLGEPW